MTSSHDNEPMRAQEALELLRAVTGTVVGTRPLEEDLAEHAHRLCLALQTDFCIIRRLEEDNLRLLASYGVEKLLLDVNLEPPYGIGQTILDTRQPMATVSIRDHATGKEYFQHPRALEIASYAGAPMCIGQEVLGIVGVYTSHQQREFSTADLNLLATFANHISVSLRNQELYHEVSKLNASLDLRVQQRTHELEVANHELEAFTYTVAHDLRAPLRSIITNSQIMLEDFGDEIPLKARVFVERQAASAKRLATMMDGLLSLARIGKYEVQKVQMSLSRLAEEISLECMRAHADRPPRFTVEPNIIVGADPRLIRILLQNLFENSIKFAKPDLPAQISVRSNPSDSTTSFIVEDQGIGFESQYAEKVFQPFERLVRQDDYPGTGIGLASVKRIVDKHKGQIEVTSTLGQGVRFTIRL